MKIIIIIIIIYNLRKCAVRNDRIGDVATAIAATSGSSGVPAGCRRSRRCSATDYDACSATAVCTVRGCSPERSSPPFLLQRLQVWWSTRLFPARHIYWCPSIHWCISGSTLQNEGPNPAHIYIDTWMIYRYTPTCSRAVPPRCVLRKSEINLLRTISSRALQKFGPSIENARCRRQSVFFFRMFTSHMFVSCVFSREKTCKSSQVYVTRPLLRERTERKYDGTSNVPLYAILKRFYDK